MIRPLHTAASAARSAGSGLLRLLYPPVCAGCGCVQPEGDPGPLCLACLATISSAHPAEAEAEVARLPGAEAVGFLFPLWLFTPGGPLQRVHHALKYGNRPLYGVRLGRYLGVDFMDTAPGPAPEIIVPVPLHRARLYERGYNQSAMIAQGVAEVAGLPLREDLLARARPTRTQTRLSREDRWENVRGAFHVCLPGAVHGHSVLLIDDVLTTGATLLAAASALSDAGALVQIATLGYAKS